MPAAAANVLATLHLILQISFISVTFLLLCVTVMNRLRVRHVLLAWRHGRLLGWPVWPSLFLGAVLLFAGGAVAAGQPMPTTLVAGYVLGGVFWFTAGLFSTSVLVTEHGLICQANRTGQTMAWEQVVDYFEVASEKQGHYVFFYQDPSRGRCRMELTVPRVQQAAFRKVIGDKLDARFHLNAQQVYGKKALEG